MTGAEDSCLFCKIVAGEVPATIVQQDERTVAFMDINSATRGHAVVVPRAHSRDLPEVGRDDLDAVMVAAQRLAQRTRDALGADGINLLNSCGEAARQTIHHLHVHVIPRYHDHPLQLPWRPQPGDADGIKAAAALLKGDG